MNTSTSRYHILGLFILLSTLLSAGGLEKGLEALKQKDYFEAHKQFHKVLFKEPVGANYGLAELHRRERSQYFDINLAYRHILKADSAFAFADEGDRERLNSLGIDKEQLLFSKSQLAETAYLKLMLDPTSEQIQKFIDKFSYSSHYKEVVDIRDERAFLKADSNGTFRAYRQFIIDYPNSDWRAAADSLYALRFFEAKTVNGDFKAYERFVREFPASPYTQQAYDTVFAYVKRKNTVADYYDYVQKFPENKHSIEAWERLTSARLRNYSKAMLQEILIAYPENPLNPDLEEELSLANQLRIPVLVDGSYRLLSHRGEFLTDRHYDGMGEYSEGRMLVEDEGKVGFINLKGDEVTGLIYDDAFAFENGVAVVEKEGLFGLIDRYGRELIPPSLDELGEYGNGLLPFRDGMDNGYISTNAERHMENRFDLCGHFQEGYAIVKANGAWGLIDSVGNYAVPPVFDWVDEAEGAYVRVRKDENFGLYRLFDTLVMPMEFQAIGAVSNGRRLAAKDGQFGYAFENGTESMPLDKYPYKPEALTFSEFKQGFALIEVDGLWGLINILGEWVHEPKYQSIAHFDGRTMSYSKAGKWGLMDVHGNMTPASYDKVVEFRQGMAVVLFKGRYGAVTPDNVVSIPIEYEGLEMISNTELLVFESEGRKGIMLRNGERLVEATYNRIEPFNIRYILCFKDGETHIYDAERHGFLWKSDYVASDTPK